MPVLSDDFVPALGLRDGNAQTTFAWVARRRRVPTRRERLATPDGDFVDVDFVDGPRGAPTLLVLHGLEGSAQSGYVQELLFLAQARGWSGAALNFRSCSGPPNLRAASYSSGDFRDVEWLARRLPRPTFAVGYSLGGSVLLNFLAQRDTGLAAAAAVSVPFDLDACARHIDEDGGFPAIYARNFLVTMHLKAEEKAERFPRELDARRIAAARTLRSFDAAVTAPLFGFESAEAYYAGCSTGRQLGRITTPTLLITSVDDPIAPARHLPPTAPDNPALNVLVTRHGGHVGFVAGSVLRPRFWSEEKVVGWLAARASGAEAQLPRTGELRLVQREEEQLPARRGADDRQCGGEVP